MNFSRAYRAASLAILIVFLIFVSGLIWYDSRITLRCTGWVLGYGPDDWLLTIRLDGPDSTWRHFFRVQEASYQTQFYQSTNAWRTESTDRQPWPFAEIDELENHVRLPLQGSTPPLNILLEIHRIRPFDGSDETKYRLLTVTYTVLGLKRQITLRELTESTDRRWVFR